MSLFRTPSARFGNLIDSGDTRKRAVDIPLYSGWSNVTNVKKMLRIALFDWLEMLKHFDAIGPNVILLRRDWLCSSTLLDISKILSDDPLSGSAQVAVSSGGVGSNPTSDKPILWLRTAAAVFKPSGTLSLQGNHFANVFFFVNIKGSRKLAFPLTENLILNVSMTLTLRKPDKDTDTCCMNMRGMLLLHSFSVSPA